MAANTVETGGRWAIVLACASGTPCAVRPVSSVFGSVLARPAIISEKKMPMDSDMPEFWKVDRMPEAAQAAGGHQQAAGGERAGAEPVRQPSRDRAGDEEPGGEREHVDARPQRRDGEVVAVQRQPDPREPDDQHELQAAAGDRAEQRG